MGDHAAIRHLEELSINAWPALHQVLSDGWLLRAANGYTRRANCVWPLYSTNLPLDARITECENFYESRGLAPTFKMTRLRCPPNWTLSLPPEVMSTKPAPACNWLLFPPMMHVSTFINGSIPIHSG